MVREDNREHLEKGCMNRENDKTVTLRAVSNKDQQIKISQEPAMKTLIEVNREMTEEEKAQTEQHLKVGKTVVFTRHKVRRFECGQDR